MTGAIVYDIEQTCWRHGWDIYNYFAIEGAVSRYGCWGAAEDWKDINPVSLFLFLSLSLTLSLSLSLSLSL